MNPFDPQLQSLAWALIHFLWQGCLVWGLTALSLRLARNSSAQVRYLLGILGLALCLALPVVTFLKLRPLTLERASVQILPPSEAKSQTAAPVAPRILVRALAQGLETSTNSHLPWVIRVWFLGSLLLALRLGGGWIGLQRLQRKAHAVSGPWQQRLERMSRALGLWRTPRFLVSNHIHSPMVVGWVRPLLLMPAGLLSGLDPTALEALMAHELAHIRRHDYFVNFTQCVVEILLFYHPAVWWISARVRTERELCCDDVAVAWCDDPQLYAETLNRLHELRTRSLTPALAASGGDLVFRIKRLLLPSPALRGTPRRVNLAALACSTALLLTAGFTTHLLRAESPQSQTQDKWFLAGSNRKDFTITPDPGTTHSGKPSMLLSCDLKDVFGFGTVMQQQPPAAFLGKRVRMSAWVKAEDVKGEAGLWLRVDGKDQTAPLAFDNMNDRAIQGTSDWRRYEVVLDVAPEARNLAFGLLMENTGRVWLDDLNFEVVDAKIPTTGGGMKALPSEFKATDWYLSGPGVSAYSKHLDGEALHGGKPSYLLASKEAPKEGFGMLIQMIKGQAYLGKRVRLSAWIKSEKVQDWAGLWMTVWGKRDGQSAALTGDNMEDRAIKGTTDWHQVKVVLDVPANTESMSFGILMVGEGKVWMAEPSLDIVDASVPSTASMH